MESTDAKKSDSHEKHCSNSTDTEIKLDNEKNITTIDSNDKLTTNEESQNNKGTMNKTINEQSTDKHSESIEFKIIYNKKKIDITFSLDRTIAELKDHLESIISVPKEMQKVMIKGLAKDQDTLRSLGLANGAKVMIVGSKLNDVLALTIPSKQDIQDDAAATASSKEPYSQQKIHRKILDKGIPEDAMPGILNSKDPLPDFPLSGMLNKLGGKVRLTFKLEQDQLWIGTKDRTDKIPMNSIKGVHSEPIHDHTEYHIMAIQLGPTDASRYWIYWVPAQYIAAIKDAILGKWGYF
ncbi:hypothetical protein PV327_007312 [Microctonus hyperodae]|uniref:Ubiquitin-like domain-containing protein n=1 Tax=Microctonus hyperodae TaxID=165561 RepID=A0AA39F6A9_MICHY|nr:hypothetical protein PV327_007312 [Microctonus hyperodae]